MMRPSFGSRHERVRSICDGGPHVDVLLHEAKSGRHHADDLERAVVELIAAADALGIATELLLPGAVADHGDASGRSDGPHRRRSCGRGAARRPARERIPMTPAGQTRAGLAGARHREKSRLPGGEARNVRLARCQSSQLAGETSAWALPAPTDSSDHHELIAGRVRQRPQQELIDDGEDGGVAADAEGQRQDDASEKPGLRHRPRTPCLTSRRTSSAKRIVPPRTRFSIKPLATAGP
jgi:hypothetical protein